MVDVRIISKDWKSIEPKLQLLQSNAKERKAKAP
jgi:hypothetical protein